MKLLILLSVLSLLISKSVGTLDNSQQQQQPHGTEDVGSESAGYATDERDHREQGSENVFEIIEDEERLFDDQLADVTEERQESFDYTLEPPPLAAQFEDSIPRQRNESFQFCPNSCGPDAVFRQQTLLAGAVKVMEGEMPWVVTIIRTFQRSYSKPKSRAVRLHSTCAGTILNSRNILTAASCLTKYKGIKQVDVFVMTGMANTTSQHIRVASTTNHLDYFSLADQREYGPVARYNYDLALLHLAEDIQFSAHVATVCIAPPLDYGMVAVITVGHGRRTSSGVGDLLRTDMVALNSRQCSEKTGFEMGETTLCALSAVHRVRRGFSGGPMMVALDGTWYQIGIASRFHFLLSSPASGTSDIRTYVKVPHFLPFIKLAVEGGVCAA